MNKVSRLFLVFMLTILTVFAVSACTKKEDNQDNKITMTEEPGIPLETYLNGNFNYAKEEYTKEVFNKIKMGHAPLYSLEATLKLTLYNQNLKKQNLKYYKTKYIYMPSIITRASTYFAGNMSTVWAGGRINYSLSYYKNGKNIYTKNIKNDGSTPALYKSWEFELDDSEFQKKYYQGEGLYVIHIHEVIVGGYHKKEKKEFTVFKNYVFALQIGDGDDLG